MRVVENLRDGRFEPSLPAVIACDTYLSHDGAGSGNKPMWWSFAVKRADRRRRRSFDR